MSDLLGYLIALCLVVAVIFIGAALIQLFTRIVLGEYRPFMKCFWANWYIIGARFVLKYSFMGLANLFGLEGDTARLFTLSHVLLLLLASIYFIKTELPLDSYWDATKVYLSMVGFFAVIIIAYRLLWP
jgi:hypothetical protein